MSRNRKKVCVVLWKEGQEDAGGRSLYALSLPLAVSLDRPMVAWSVCCGCFVFSLLHFTSHKTTQDTPKKGAFKVAL